MKKINISIIFSSHFKSLCHDAEGNFSYKDFILFIIFPMCFGLTYAYFVDYSFIKNNLTDLITFYSVFGGFLLNMLVLISGYDMIKFKNKEDAKQLLNETTINVSFLIAISAIILPLLLLSVSLQEIGKLKETFLHHPNIVFYSKYALMSFIFFVFVNFFLTIFMVLKRFHTLSAKHS